jgi:hypothetical protein
MVKNGNTARKVVIVGGIAAVSAGVAVGIGRHMTAPRRMPANWRVVEENYEEVQWDSSIADRMHNRRTQE